MEAALAQGRLEVLWETTPTEIARGPGAPLPSGREGPQVPADQVFVFIGGELPTAFLRSCGVEIETHFGAP